jgi:SAM-dependent methyltransferase
MPKRPWYETLFRRDYYDYFAQGGPRGIFTPEQYAKMTDAQVDFLVRVLELPEGARVLDLCCGHGRHAVRLAQRGYRSISPPTICASPARPRTRPGSTLR